MGEEFGKIQHKSIVFIGGSEAAVGAGREKGWGSLWVPRHLSTQSQGLCVSSLCMACVHFLTEGRVPDTSSFAQGSKY